MRKAQNGIPTASRLAAQMKMVPMPPGKEFCVWLEPETRYVTAGETIGVPVRGEDDGIGYIRRTIQQSGFYFTFGAVPLTANVSPEAIGHAQSIAIVLQSKPTPAKKRKTHGRRR